MLLGAGELDGVPREWLRDPRPGVRLCAAPAPALADDPEATAVLLTEAARSPAVIDMQALEGTMTLTVLPNAAAVLAERLCRSVGDVDRLLPASSPPGPATLGGLPLPDGCPGAYKVVRPRSASGMP
jgi:hypothetical protein